MIPRTSPASPISPNTAVAAATGRLRRLDAIAAATLRSAAGSSMPHAAGDVDEDVLTHQVQARRASRAPRGAARAGRVRCRTAIRRALPNVLALTSACTSTSSGREPFDGAVHGGAWRVDGTLGQEERRRVRDGAQALARHLEDAKLADRAEPVLHRAHHAMRVMPFPFEVQHGVDDVLERLRAGQIAFLGDVADDERRDVVASWRRTAAGWRPPAPGRCCRAPTASSSRRSSGSSRRRRARASGASAPRGCARGTSRRADRAARGRRRGARRAT